MLDVTVSEDTPVWCRGLNKSPSELETKMVTSLQRELDKTGLYLEKLPDGGVALHTETARREGDEICLVTGLLYDSVASLTTFLSHGGNRVLVDRLVEIRGLGLADETEGSLYMAITGVARYLRHYLGVRRGGPNAVLMVQTGNGCGDGLVKCVVQTRNGVGIAAKSPVVINYGNEYDINVATMAASSDEGDAKRFRGVLDEYFKKQSAWSAPAAANSETAGAGAASAASEANAIKAASAASEPATPTKGTPPPKVVPNVVPKQDPSPTGAEATKRPSPQPTGTPPPKVAKAGECELGTITAPISASLILSENRLIVRPHGSVEGSKKITPKIVMAKCKDGKVQKTSKGGPPWSFKNGSTLVVNPSGQVVKMAEFCDSASCKTVARHKGAVTGSLAVQGDVCGFEATRDEWQKAIRLATELAQVSVMFVVKKRTDAPEAIPSGIALTISKQIIVKAGEDFVLQ